MGKIEDLAARVDRELQSDQIGDEWGRGAWHDLAEELVKALKDEREKREEQVAKLLRSLSFDGPGKVQTMDQARATARAEIEADDAKEQSP
jgi:hypothetical protein